MFRLDLSFDYVLGAAGDDITNERWLEVTQDPDGTWRCDLWQRPYGIEPISTGHPDVRQLLTRLHEQRLAYDRAPRTLRSTTPTREETV